jgi:adenylyltransferase/sulfurtransferase
VLGVLPGVIGLIQGVEILKLLLDLGETLIGRLLLFDALAMRFREVRLGKDPTCPICSEQPTIRELIDYEAFCGLTPAPADAESFEIGPRELAAALARGETTLIDVREPHEHEIAHIEGARLIPLGRLPESLGELDSSEQIVLHCHTGERSMRALEFLRQSGFRKLRNLRGGIDAWSREVDPEVPRY